MPARFWEVVGRLIGEPGHKPDFYRDFFLTLIFVLPFTVAVVAATDLPHLCTQFCWGGGISVLVLLLAKRKRLVIGTGLAWIAFRLVIGGLLRGQPILFLGALAMGAAALGLLLTVKDVD